MKTVCYCLLPGLKFVMILNSSRCFLSRSARKGNPRFSRGIDDMGQEAAGFMLCFPSAGSRCSPEEHTTVTGCAVWGVFLHPDSGVGSSTPPLCSHTSHLPLSNGAYLPGDQHIHAPDIFREAAAASLSPFLFSHFYVLIPRLFKKIPSISHNIHLFSASK